MPSSVVRAAAHLEDDDMKDFNLVSIKCVDFLSSCTEKRFNVRERALHNGNFCSSPK